MYKHWSEIFGNFVTASEVIREAESGNMDLATFLHETYAEMYPNDARPNFDRLAAEITTEANKYSLAIFEVIEGSDEWPLIDTLTGETPEACTAKAERKYGSNNGYHWTYPY